jgi:hypothetical protein
MWSVPVELVPGSNTVRVKSVDMFGNESAIVTRTLIFVVTNTLTVATNGTGSISPVLNGKSLEIGKGYMLTATPGLGYVFSNWTSGGEVVSTSNKYTFLMETNLMLTANFVPNPFVQVKGVYNGLFYESDEVRLESSGLLNLTLSDKGAFTGKLLMGAKPLTVAGRFDLNGHATNDVPRRGTNALRLELEIDLADIQNVITGKVVNPGQWEAPLSLDRAVYGKTNPPPYAGQYTVIVPGTPGDPNMPEGDSFGTIKVDAAGNVSFTGVLADGTKVTQRVPVSTDGDWPFYVSLYKGLGSLLGWINFNTLPVDDLSEEVSWIKLNQPKTRLYQAGFTNQTAAFGSLYVAPVGTTNRAIEVTNGAVAFIGGNLAEPLTNSITLGPGSKVTNNSSNKLTLTITAKTGLFKGSVTPPGSTRPIAFQGVLVQTNNTGSGFFAGTNRVGQVRVEAAP